jgi:hypothetical protein
MGTFVTCAVPEKLLGQIKEDEGVGACSTQVDMIHTYFSSGNLQEEDTRADLCVNGRTVLKQGRENVEWLIYLRVGSSDMLL